MTLWLFAGTGGLQPKLEDADNQSHLLPSEENMGHRSRQGGDIALYVYALLPMNTHRHTHRYCGPALVVSPQWEKPGSSLIGKNRQRELLLSLSFTLWVPLPYTQMYMHTHPHTAAERGGLREGREGGVCVPRRQFLGWRGRVPRALSGQESFMASSLPQPATKGQPRRLSHVRSIHPRQVM